MNIWCISKYASIPKYGAAARLFYLAKEFKKDGNDVLLLTSDANHLCNFPATDKRYNEELIDDVEVCWIKTKKYKNSASIARVLSWFDFEIGLFGFKAKERKKPDVIIVSSLSLLSILYGYFLKRRYHSFLVFEIRDIWPLTLVAEGGFSKWHPLTIFLGLIEKFGYKYSDMIVGTMPRLDLHVKNILGYKREVFCSPIGLDDSQVSKFVVKRDLDDYFPEDKTIIGYAGSMGISNALEPYVKCMEALEDNNDIHFLLVGSGDLKEEYQHRLRNNPNVTFVPKIKQEHVQYFLSMCDILYLSTHDSEVWRYGQSMNKVVQYMLSGKPIIASYSGYESMLNEAQSGQFVPSNKVEPLMKVLNDYVSLPGVERDEIGNRGRVWILENRFYSYLAKQYLDKIDCEREKVSQ